MPESYDAILLVSFGGPERREDVMPFLENVLRGKNVPRERMLEVAEHYYEFGGVSPINAQNRALIAALVEELNQHGPQLPIYWGNRNWHPMLADTLEQMREDGVKNAMAIFTSAFSSYSGCRQYRENIIDARAEVEGAPEIHKIRGYFNHPGFIEAMVDRVSQALEEIPPERRSAARLIFTAHSIPLSMAGGCQYETQLNEACRLVATALEHEDFDLVYQSRSGPPTQPWLEPDICDHLKELAEGGATRDVVVIPIGFVSDHMEVLFDLDTEASELCEEHGINMVRAATVGTHPRFVTMLRELIIERMEDATPVTVGDLAALPHQCPADCCPSGRPARP